LRFCVALKKKATTGGRMWMTQGQKKIALTMK
jgi:hypothetical protein